MEKNCLIEVRFCVLLQKKFPEVRHCDLEIL